MVLSLPNQRKTCVRMRISHFAILPLPRKVGNSVPHYSMVGQA
jgi:hypothetical protein